MRVFQNLFPVTWHQFLLWDINFRFSDYQFKNVKIRCLFIDLFSLALLVMWTSPWISRLCVSVFNIFVHLYLFGVFFVFSQFCSGIASLWMGEERDEDKKKCIKVNKKKKYEHRRAELLQSVSMWIDSRNGGYANKESRRQKVTYKYGGKNKENTDEKIKREG